MLEEGLVALLAGNAGVSTLLGTHRSDGTNGIFALEALKDVTVPYIVYEQVSSDPNETMEGLNKFQGARYRFKCYAADYPTAARLCHAVRMCLGGFIGTLADKDSTPVQYCTPVFEGALPVEASLRATILGRAIDFALLFVDTTS